MGEWPVIPSPPRADELVGEDHLYRDSLSTCPFTFTTEPEAEPEAEPYQVRNKLAGEDHQRARHKREGPLAA